MCISSGNDKRATEERTIMLRLALLLLALALIAAFLGFYPVAGMAWEGFKIVFLVFVILAVLAFLGGMFRRPVV
jgi:uncharacterized membrane protein YtjA (UPF0391 family)